MINVWKSIFNNFKNTKYTENRENNLTKQETLPITLRWKFLWKTCQISLCHTLSKGWERSQFQKRKATSLKLSKPGI